MEKTNWFREHGMILLTGVVIGIAALVLTAHGNPGNMGFCIACFLRDIAGASASTAPGRCSTSGLRSSVSCWAPSARLWPPRNSGPRPAPLPPCASC